MIPILYDRTETTFSSEGLGRLNCSRCVVTEERNGIYEVEFDMPVTGTNFDSIEIGRIIACTHDDTGEVEPFDIYKKSEPVNGIVTFYGHHISYRLNEIPVKPFTASSCSAALAGLKSNSVVTNPFAFATDKNVTSTYTLTRPASLRGLLGGEENSILDVYGKGEYKFSKWNVNLYTNRGSAKSTTIRYGKNLVDYTNEYDSTDTYTAVYPYWQGSVGEGDAEPQDVLVTLPEYYISSGESVPSGRQVIVPMDLSQEFEEKPTVAELRDKATSMLNASEAWVPKQTITIDFVALWQTDEYKDLEPLQSVNLCDTVGVVISMYKQSFRAKVIKTVYNVLLDRYDELELGDTPSTYAQVITSGLGQQFTDLAQKAQAAQAQADFASRVAGNTDQHFWFTETGTDTGAHITEVTQDEFLADPTMGGGNLLARSNGVAVRKGLTEVATFTQSGVTFADDVESTAYFSGDGARMGKESSFHVDISRSDMGDRGGGYIGIFEDEATEIARFEGSSDEYGDSVSIGVFSEAYMHNTIGTGTDLNTTYESYANLVIANPVGGMGSRSVSFDMRVDSNNESWLTCGRDLRVLWDAGSEAYYMVASSSINLSYSVSDQLNGIVLVWSRYASGTVYNDSWCYQFIPKWHTKLHNGGGVYVSMPVSNTASTVCNKYVYIYDDHIGGHASNSANGTGYDNRTRVLRAVLGV